MAKKLPPRPNLDHLRRQAKALLAALEARDKAAAETILEHLPAAKGMTPAQVMKMELRLADAQSAIARKSGFASWPHLARHVEQLRALEGELGFARLEVDGSAMPAGALGSSRLLIDGDRFRTESPEANYEGVFNINVEAVPHEIDIEFVEGPEAGNWNYGIFRFDGERLEICLDMNGKARPAKFGTSAGSGHAWEIFERSSQVRPADVAGGKAGARKLAPAAQECVGFEYVESATMAKLQGDWGAVKITRDGQELPAMMLRTGLRTANKNEVKILFGGQTMIHALVKMDENSEPIRVDYYNMGGMSKGAVQLGIMKWEGEDVCFCMGGPGEARPGDFTSGAGSGRTLSQWRRKQ